MTDYSGQGKQLALKESLSKPISRQTPAGTITIQSFPPPEAIRECRFDEQFGFHAQYKSIYTKRETLEAHAALADTNVVLALTDDHRIIGFGVFGPPDADKRWLELGFGIMMEVKVVEVSRRYRAFHLASDMLRQMLAHPRIDSVIAYMVGYTWTWDLNGSGLTAQQYRNVLIRLFGAQGFAELSTNESNICLKPENLFMARIGRDVSEKTRQDFKWLRFGITP
jgi:acetoin utilization protein AcuA